MWPFPSKKKFVEMNDFTLGKGGEILYSKEFSSCYCLIIHFKKFSLDYAFLGHFLPDNIHRILHIIKEKFEQNKDIIKGSHDLKVYFYYMENNSEIFMKRINLDAEAVELAIKEEFKIHFSIIKKSYNSRKEFIVKVNKGIKEPNGHQVLF